MARYDYRCPVCNTTFEFEHPMRERPTVYCPNCGAEATQVFEPSGIVFKGTGFYNTDLRDNRPSAAEQAAADDAAEAAEAATANIDTSNDDD